jgi:hypothetical protein
MHWYTFAANLARAIALVTAINVSLAVLLIFFNIFGSPEKG